MVQDLAAMTSRSAWTDAVWKSHYSQQALRFVRLFVIAFAVQIAAWSQNGIESHMTWKVLYSLAIAAGEVVWREIFPAMKVDIVPEPVIPPAHVSSEPAHAAHTPVKKTAKKATKASPTRRTPRR